MRPTQFHADNANVVVRPNHVQFDHFKSPHLSDGPLSLLYGHGLGGSRWQALRIQVPDEHAPSYTAQLINQDGLSPLLVPTHDTRYDEAHWSNVLPSTQQASSPRQRAGFPRSINGLESMLLSPILSDTGLASPSLPVLSPHATERSRRTIARKRRRLTAPAFLNSQTSWLTLYFAFNLGLTLYNKLVLVQFPYPYTLTALHALCGSLGGWVLQHQGAYVPAPLAAKHYTVLAAFSALYAVNIAVSNVSLQLVTVPFHQVVRAATPIFTTALSFLLFGTRYTRLKLFTLIPVMFGVALATYGDYYFTMWGFLLTLFGTFLAAVKTIYTNVLQSSPPLASKPTLPSPLEKLLPVPPRLSLQPLDLLSRTSPFACALCIVYAYGSGELLQARDSLAFGSTSGWFKLAVLLGNGAIAFGLNVVSLSANKRVGALNMTVAANVKQALTILCAVSLFHLTITPLNALGICITLAGGAWYAWVEYIGKMERKREQSRRALTSAAVS